MRIDVSILKCIFWSMNFILLVGCILSHEASKAERANHYIQQGQSSFEEGDYSKAVISFNTAIGLDSSNAKAYIYLICSIMERDSLHDYFEIGLLNPNKSQAFFDLPIERQNEIYQMLQKLDHIASIYVKVSESSGIDENQEILYGSLSSLEAMLGYAQVNDKNHDGIINETDVK